MVIIVFRRVSIPLVFIPMFKNRKTFIQIWKNLLFWPEVGLFYGKIINKIVVIIIV